MKIDRELVKNLIAEQFPEFSNLEIREVKNSGHDNRTFHLGKEMLVRLPSGADYESQIDKELKWLPILKDKISLNIPTPIRRGEKNKNYPFNWSINKWIEGETLNYKNVHSLEEVAVDLAKFLKELQGIDASLGPVAGKHNFYRGGLLEIYDRETREALENLKDIFDTSKLEKIWEESLKSVYRNKPCWVHGDIAVGNLIVSRGELVAVIDFGILGTGDPACDYVIAWTFFKDKSRIAFIKELKCNKETLDRAKGWALWKALITYEIENKESNNSVWAKSCINQLLESEKL